MGILLVQILSFIIAVLEQILGQLHLQEQKSGRMLSFFMEKCFSINLSLKEPGQHGVDLYRIDQVGHPLILESHNSLAVNYSIYQTTLVLYKVDEFNPSKQTELARERTICESVWELKPNIMVGVFDIQVSVPECSTYGDCIGKVSTRMELTISESENQDGVDVTTVSLTTYTTNLGGFAGGVTVKKAVLGRGLFPGILRAP